MKRSRRAQLLGFWLLVCGCFLAGSATACPAYYVQSKADQAKGTWLHKKATRVANKYMEKKGMVSTSSQADIIRPYIVGTSLVEHDWAMRKVRTPFAHSLKKWLHRCVQDSLRCGHHSRHFRDGKKIAGQLMDAPPSAALNLGG